MKQKINKENNFYYLTGALILLLISSSLAPYGLLGYVLDGFVVLTFISCLLSLRFDTRWHRFLIGLAVCWLVAVIIHRLFDFEKIDSVRLLLMLTFFFGTFKSIARQILFTDNVSANKIIGSMALFLLLGLMWAVMYLLILEFSPEAFNGISYLPWSENFSRMCYFSFVTLTTLGYGDVSPALPFSEVVVYLEAITGVFYMAIVVASLVSSNQSNQEKQNG